MTWRPDPDYASGGFVYEDELPEYQGDALRPGLSSFGSNLLRSFARLRGVNPYRAVRIWQLEREIERKLAARKALRSKRREAALKGWQTRRWA